MGILEKMKGKKAPFAKASGAKKAAPAATAKEEKVEKKAVVRGPLAREGAGDAYRILLAPVLTEKSSLLQSSNQYTFAVAKSATKIDVARAVRDLYGVKPVQVRVVNAKGKSVRFGRSQGQEKDVKKAIVTLKKGETIFLTE